MRVPVAIGRQPYGRMGRYAGPVKRRGITLVVGLVVLVVLFGLVSVAKVPYVELGPGPTVDTLGSADGHEVIQVSGIGTTKSTGELRLVTVNVQPEVSLWEALRGWLQPDYAVVPTEIIYPPNLSQQQVDQQNAQEFKDSQNSAETAALRALGYPVVITVSEVVAGSPAQGHLQVGDVITSVDGQAATTGETLVSLIHAKPIGTPLRIGYTRSGVAGTTTITTTAGQGGQPQIGVGITQKQPHPFTISFDLSKIGGPSAGLMFALGIVDKIKESDLTGGLDIAGTGTIDDNGVVGPIGGIAQKMIGAKDAGATVFLTPAQNCSDALASAVPGLELVKVNTLDDALNALAALREHRQPALCTG